ncbi:PAS domain S-box protein [Oscillatoria sp. FACHB-1407]|uniref:PAS domain S-box protein n=1 Tax=Oscillatoria sp. FACHB-1407 TaxID=2692847 RepID=UPI001685E3CC|nr:PAS domain S-box protein [Oscillatoria sp. FACHB-1407]MBD2465248.1 PAS domain S-box protein [Oscillatoria sp. FACHB-1407]
MSVYQQFFPYIVSIASTAVALFLSLWLDDIIFRTVGALFYVAIAISTWYGGLKPGIVASVLSLLAIHYYFFSPLHQFPSESAHHALRLLLVALVSVIITLLSSNLRQSRQKVERLSRKLIEESSDRLRTVLNAAQMGMWDWDLLTGEIIWSPEHEQLFGLSPGSFDGKYETFARCVHPDDLGGIGDAVTYSLQHNVAYHHEYRIIWADGSIHWVEGRGRAFYNDEGQPVRMSGTIMAIDQRKQTEEALRQSEAHQRALIKAIPDLIMRINRTGLYLEFVASPNFRIVGTISTMVGSHIFDVLPPDLAQKYMDSIQEALDTKSVQVYEQTLLIDGITQIEEVRIVPYGEDEVLALVQDISDRKQAEERLRDISDRLNLAVQSVRGAIWDWDVVNDHLLWDERAYELYGVQHSNVRETYATWEARIHPDDVIPCHILTQQALAGEAKYQTEFRAVLPDGTIRYIESHAVVERDPDGRPLRMIGMDLDISDRKQTEFALHQSEQTNRTIMETIPDLLIQMDRRGYYSSMSGGGKVRVQYPPKSSSEPTVYSVLSPELAEQRLYYANQAIESSSLQIYEQIFNTNGEERYEEVRIAPLNEQEVLVMIRDITDRKQAETALKRLVESTAAVTGKDFFSTLAQQLMLALKVQYVLITKVGGDHLQTLAYWKDGKPQADMIFAITDIPGCDAVTEHERLYCPKDFQQHFSNYSLAQALQVDSYLGIPLVSTSNQKLGNICIMDNKPMHDIQLAEAFLRIFATRAAAELERQQATEALEQLNQELEAHVEERTAALRQSEAELSAIFNQAAVGISLATPDGQYLKVNQKLCDILGYTQQELLTKTFKDLCHPEDVNKGEEGWQQLRTRAIDSFSIEKRCLHKNGRIVWVNLTASLVGQPTSELDYSIGVVEDISDRKRAEESLQQSEERFRTVFDCAPIAISLVKIDTYEVFRVNAAHRQIFGYSEAELATMFLADLSHPDDLEKDVAQVERMVRGEIAGFQMEKRFITKSGNVILSDMTVALIRDSDGHPLYSMAMIEDITERKQSEMLLKAQQEFLRRLIDTVPNLIFVKDWEGRFTLVNQATANLYNTSIQNLIGKTDADFNPNEVEIEQSLAVDREVMTTMTLKVLEETFTTADGQQRYFQTIKTPIQSANGHFKEVLGVATDISDRQQIEIALRQSEEQLRASLEEKNVLLQEIHHRVKNNLQTISSLLRLQANTISDPMVLELLKESQSRVQSMALIHEKLYQSPNFARINVAEYIRELTQYLFSTYLTNANSIRPHITVDSIEIDIHIANPIGLILNELLTNALKYAFPNQQTGIISIQFHCNTSSQYCLTVADNGIGLPEDLDIYTTRSLGLKLVQILTRQLGGILEVNRDRGTCFTLAFSTCTKTT